MAEIILEGVGKRFPDGTVAVSDVNLDIADQEFIILVGPSGCGKSTTLNMIAGLEDISEGELRIDGTRMNERAPRDRDIAMVFQSYALYPHMTVRQNMEFPLKLAKVDAATVTQKIEHAAEILELTPHLDRKPGNLSGGQRQRVAMGRAIVRNPKAFLMDEPLSNLDAKLRVQMRTSISRLQKSLGTTTVYVTHDQTEAMTLGDRIVLMRAGVVQQIGTPEELYERPVNLFVAGFIGSPSMNFMAGRIESGDVESSHAKNGTMETVLGSIPLTDRLRRGLEKANFSGRDVVVGLRPEAMEDEELAASGALGKSHEGGERVVFTNTVDILESLGAVKLAYFNFDASGVTSAHLAEVSRATSDDTFGQSQVVAQLDARTRAREGQELRVSFSADDVLLFDPASGANVTLP